MSDFIGSGPTFKICKECGKGPSIECAFCMLIGY